MSEKDINLEYFVYGMSINEFLLEFHAIESRINSGQFKRGEKPYQEFALKIFTQTDCKSLTVDDAIKAVELMIDLNVKLHQEFVDIGEGGWLSTTSKYKTIVGMELIIFVLYPMGVEDSTAEPKVCVIEVP
ncbi:unnamed protein product [marine sediment metagenome]|uniref:Uncharacterized protein n=1 Tax=marine sediment metagenome TaxID=412755 RepID=X1CQ54_9ZZZZ